LQDLILTNYASSKKVFEICNKHQLMTYKHPQEVTNKQYC